MKLIDLSKRIEETPPDYLKTEKLRAGVPYRVHDHEIRFLQTCSPDGGPSPHPNSSGRTTSRIEAPAHLGTHIDAPRHPGYGGKETIDMFPLEKFYSDAFYLDMTHKLPGGAITLKELKDAIGADLRENNAVIIRTGVGRFEKDHPYLETDAAKWLVEKKVGLLVMDTVPSKVGTNESSKILYEGKVLPVTESINLDKITKKKGKFMAMPLRLIGLEVSPVRAVWIEE